MRELRCGPVLFGVGDGVHVVRFGYLPSERGGEHVRGLLGGKLLRDGGPFGGDGRMLGGPVRRIKRVGVFGVLGGKLLRFGRAVKCNGPMRRGPVLVVGCVGVLGVRLGELLRDGGSVDDDGTMRGGVVLVVVGERVHIVRIGHHSSERGVFNVHGLPWRKLLRLRWSVGSDGPMLGGPVRGVGRVCVLGLLGGELLRDGWVVGGDGAL